MANRYVWSGASGSGSGADWANAYLTLQAAAAASAAGDVFYVAHDHSQTQASGLGIIFTPDITNPQKVYCVHRAGSVPPVPADLQTTAQIAATGNNTITIQGNLSECNGIIFRAGSGGTSSGSILLGSHNATQRYVNCSMRLAGLSASARIGVNTNLGSCTIFENTTVQLAANDQRLNASTKFYWRNTSSNALETGSIVPPLFMQASGYVFMEGLNLSNISSTYLFDISQAGQNATIILKDCRLSPTGALTNSALNSAQSLHALDLQVIRSDSADTVHRNERHTASGSMTTETTIVRTAGASDGTTPISWKVVTSDKANWGFPFECLPISIWNETTGLMTVTLQGIWGGGSPPNNDDIWMDIEALTTSGYPLAGMVTTNKATGLSTNTPLPSGAGTWGGSTTKFALICQFVPLEKGPITIYVRAAKPSSTFYIDPKPQIS